MHVVAPANKTQAPASGEVPLDVRVAPNLDPATLRVWIVAGWPDPPRTTEITARLTTDATGATAAIHAADLPPGLTTIKARAARTNGHGNETGLRELLVGADRRHRYRRSLRPDRGQKCLMPFPNDFFTVADPTSGTGRRVHFDRRSMPSNSQRRRRSTRPSGTATTASAPAP